MSIQFKIREDALATYSKKVAEVLSKAGFDSKPLFGDNKNRRLSSIFTIAAAKPKDLPAIKDALGQFHDIVEYAESSPNRRPR